MPVRTQRFEFPPYPANGAPLFWQHEQSGVLASAVHAYLDNRLHHRPIGPADCDLLAGYLRYYIHAPLWDHCPGASARPARTLKRLRETADRLTDAVSIDRWIGRALKYGIDPL